MMSLGAAGTALQKQTRDLQSRQTVHRAELPVNASPYEGGQLQAADTYTSARAAAMTDRATLFPEGSNVVPRTRPGQGGSMVYSELAGRDFASSEFRHTNMQPFYGAKIRQNTNVHANDTLLEMYTGVGGVGYRDKEEVTSMFAPAPGMDNVFGSKVQTDFLQSRVVGGTKMNNVLPFKQVRVGPGLGLGADGQSRGGFQQYEAQDHVRATFKTVDELRPANKPKLTYHTPLVAGKAPSQERATAPNVSENRNIFRYHERHPDDLLPTRAAITRPAPDPCIVVKPTERGERDTTHFAPGVAPNARGEVPGRESRCPRDPIELHKSGTPTNVVMTTTYPGYVDDHGKFGVVVPTTNKEYLVASSASANMLTAAFKAFVAPITDALRSRKEELGVMNHRENGGMAPQIPGKATIVPGDGMRTTLKETTVHDVPESMIAGRSKGALAPTDAARTTLKEQNIHDVWDGVVDTGVRCVAYYDPRDVAKTTRRETLGPEPFVKSLTGVKKMKVSPTDRPRVTVKETTIDCDWTGGVSSMGGRGTPAGQYQGVGTNRETTSLYNHYGGVAGSGAPGAYSTDVVEARMTTKQFLVDNETYGGAAVPIKGMTDRTAENNAHFDAGRELLMMESGASMAPTGPKSAIGAANLHATRLVDRTVDNTYEVVERVHDAGIMRPASPRQAKNPYLAASDSDRIDPNMLSVLRDNPFMVPSLVPNV
jgi:hypothetical protein